MLYSVNISLLSALSMNLTTSLSLQLLQLVYFLLICLKDILAAVLSWIALIFHPFLPIT